MVNTYKIDILNHMEQNTSKKICQKCGTEWCMDAHYCGVCGSELEYNKKEMFGNGLPLKYFNFLYNVLPIFSVVILFILTLSSFNDFVTYFNSDIIYYLSFFSMQFTLIILILNYIFVGITLYTRVKNNKIGFSKVMIYRLIFAVLSPIVSLIPLYFDHGINSIVVNETMISLLFPIVTSSLTTIYLVKRFNFKWFDFSDIL